jgi:hypothetical protein
MASIKENNISKSSQEDAPPIFKSWSGWYLTVLVFLFLELLLFYIIAKVF